MIQVREATLISGPEGATLQATMTIAHQTVTMTMPVTRDDQQLSSALDGLGVRVQNVTLRATETGGEIAITLLIGGRPFVGRLPVDGTERDLLLALDRLTADIDKT